MATMESDTGITWPKPDLTTSETCDPISEEYIFPYPLLSDELKMKYPIINSGNPMNVSDEWKRRFHADALYLEQSRNLSYYDAIPLPPTTMFMGGSPVTPLVITETDRPVLINFSKIALDHYNHNHNQGSDSSFEFVDLVKCSFYNDFRAVPTDFCADLDPAEYYITFQAKDPFDTIRIFQTKVLVDQHDKHKLPVVEECRIKI